MISSLDQLTPATRDAALAWLDSAERAVAPDLRATLRDELTIALCERLDADANEADVAALAADLTPVDPDGATDERRNDPRVGRWFGIPFDVRPPTADRLREALWDPADPRLLRPRAFGAGWDLNLGAAAVKAGLIEPDAEDEPFAHTGREAFIAAAGFPVLMAAAVVAHYAVRGRSLPDELPSHWDAAGRPDRWVTRRTAAGVDIGLALAAAGLGATAATAPAPNARKAGRLALAAALAGGVAKQTVVRPMKGGWWVGPVLVGGVVGSAGATLLGLALAGRAGERRRDLGDQSARP
ncbi:MAG: DUF1648 domain-containing protein [Propionibacteriaceae bacterium]|nr:DUF1648 domain-containing protein [Propionibacteriaceae bacterium]